MTQPARVPAGGWMGSAWALVRQVAVTILAAGAAFGIMALVTARFGTGRFHEDSWLVLPVLGVTLVAAIAWGLVVGRLRRGRGATLPGPQAAAPSLGTEPPGDRLSATGKVLRPLLACTLVGVLNAVLKDAWAPVPSLVGFGWYVVALAALAIGLEVAKPLAPWATRVAGSLDPARSRTLVVALVAGALVALAVADLTVAMGTLGPTACELGYADVCDPPALPTLGLGGWLLVGTTAITILGFWSSGAAIAAQVASGIAFALGALWPAHILEGYRHDRYDLNAVVFIVAAVAWLAGLVAVIVAISLVGPGGQRVPPARTGPEPEPDPSATPWPG